MAPKKDTVQDDYYANLSPNTTSAIEEKKPVKIKKKPIIKKTNSEEKSSVESEKKPKIMARKKEENSSKTEEKNSKKPANKSEKNQARLVKREHAGKDLLRSVMSKTVSSSENSEKSDEKKSPNISFGGVSSTFKPLENRPVMKTPEEERREARKKRQKNRSENRGDNRNENRGNQGENRRENRESKNENRNGNNQQNKNNNRKNQNNSQNNQKKTDNKSQEKRLRDDSKPMFQRDIGYSTPVRDGTGKKGKKQKNHYDKKETGHVEMDDSVFRRDKKINNKKKKEKSVEEISQILTDKTGQEVAIPENISVKEFSDKIGVPVAKIIGELMKNGVLVTLNASIDFDTSFLIGETFGIKIIREISEDVSVTDLMDGDISSLISEEDLENLEKRSPIISVMGHVDHGKTSILDYIRKSSVASGEAGGITQKIGAYQVEKNGQKITFLDTPGHEAFTIMRARGAKLTDIAVIVIAADEGMKPQTIESISHAREAGVPIIVAANKMDKPGVNLDLIRGQMAEQGLQPEDWGGDVVLVPVSAHTGLGMDTLLDMILLQAEMLELKANPNRSAIATVIEATLDPKLGSVATILVNTGSITKGDHIVCAGASGKVRTLKDYRGKNIETAGPSVPVQITGLSEVVVGGDILQVVSSAEIATTRAKEFALAKNAKSIHAFEGASLNMLMSRLKSGALKQLKIVLKTDSGGSLEALKAALSKLSTPETQVTFIHSAVGDVNQSDVMMAGTSQALLIAYNVGVIAQAKSALSQSKIEFIDKKVIYHIIEKVEAIITGMVDLKMEEQELGTAKIKAIFHHGGKADGIMTVGLGVELGRIEPRAKVRVIRGDHKVGSGELIGLKKGPLDVVEVLEGEECGIKFKGDTALEVGDVLEFYKMVQRK